MRGRKPKVAGTYWYSYWVGMAKSECENGNERGCWLNLLRAFFGDPNGPI